MSISASDIEKSALIKSHTVDGESTTMRSAEDAERMIRLAQNNEVNTPAKKQSVLSNLYNFQLQKTE